jgi:hypothetical protein
MTDDQITSADKVQDKREKLIEEMREKAHTVREEASKAGLDYKKTVETEAGEWTLKWDEDKIEYLRFKNRCDIYVVSKFDNEAKTVDLVKAANDFQNFIQGFNDWLDK